MLCTNQQMATDKNAWLLHNSLFHAGSYNEGKRNVKNDFTLIYFEKGVWYTLIMNKFIKEQYSATSEQNFHSRQHNGSC